jgi:hypothetical protein
MFSKRIMQGVSPEFKTIWGVSMINIMFQLNKGLNSVTFVIPLPQPKF